MGLLDSLFGRKKLPPSNTALLGAISTAELTVRTELGLEPVPEAGLAVRPVAASQFARVREELESLLRVAAKDMGAETRLQADEYGMLWVIVADPDFPDVVATAQIAAQTITEEGFRDQLLCAVFPFADASKAVLNLVYSFKRGSFYAFAPRPGNSRDVTLEIRAHSILEGELPLEKDMSFRYPLWGLPFGAPA